MKPHRATIAALLALCAFAGCDRNSTPQQIGRPAPAFSVTDGGKTVSLAQFRGRVVVLNFWASWCAPCLEETPSLEAMQQQLPQITLIGISTDENAEAYTRFLATNHVHFLTIRDASQTSNAAYGSFRYPETYVIDKTGILRRKFIGPQTWTSPEIIDYLRKLSQ